MKEKKRHRNAAPGISRYLKIERVGDFASGKVVPRIRMAGQWLERAGFKPGNRVLIRMERRGKLRLSVKGSRTTR